MAKSKFRPLHDRVVVKRIDAIKAHVPAPVDNRSDDEKLLNGPKLAGDAGHASQDDIDALFD